MKILSQKKIIIISGPTATGKTALALSLAKKYNGELISADSRQIYSGLDIGTGKDHPSDTDIHLIDIIRPNEIFSSAQYSVLASQKIKDIYHRKKIPIIVGGSGQYIDSLINPQPTFHIKPNNVIRFFLNRLSIRSLQRIYQFVQPKTYTALNNSEKNNPHRLIRKIEIYFSMTPPTTTPFFKIDNYLHLSLTAPNAYLYQRIDKRVKQRLKAGLLKEIKKISQDYSWASPGLNTLAYREFRDYFENKISLKQAIEVWKYDEHAYLRRQKTYFKKMPGLIFIDISQKAYPKSVYPLVREYLEVLNQN